MKSRLRAQKALLLSEVERVTKQRESDKAMANECLSSNYKMCPNIKDLRTFVSNLSSCNN